MKRINHHQHDNTLETDIVLLVKTEKNIYKALIKNWPQENLSQAK